VGKIQVLELNQNLDIISETPYEGEYFDGDIFTYTSVIASDTITRPEDVPRALQMTITARNENEEDLVNFWIIIFDNSCGIYPVVLEGEQIGWTIFVSTIIFHLDPPAASGQFSLILFVCIYYSIAERSEFSTGRALPIGSVGRASNICSQSSTATTGINPATLPSTNPSFSTSTSSYTDMSSHRKAAHRKGQRKRDLVAQEEGRSQQKVTKGEDFQQTLKQVLRQTL
jgi:hypothetical protein